MFEKLGVEGVGLREGIKKGADWILDLIYPKCCPLCGQVRPYKESMACKACVMQLKRVQPDRCLKCGKHLEEQDVALCGDCEKMPKSFIRGYPAFEYADPIKKALYDFKYKNQRAYAEFFAAGMYSCVGQELKELQVDGILPVPVHRRKRRKRGYNQAHLLALELGKRLEVPVCDKLLIREVDTNPQKELNDKQRLNNLKNAFKMNGNAIKLKKVLLVDDIYTSGATIESCTRVLMEAGVEEVYYTSVAIGKGY